MVVLFDLKHCVVTKPSHCLCVIVFQTEQQLDCALDLMRRLPPQQIEKNLSDLIDLVSYRQHLVLFILCYQTKSQQHLVIRKVFMDFSENE